MFNPQQQKVAVFAANVHETGLNSGIDSIPAFLSNGPNHDLSTSTTRVAGVVEPNKT